MKKSDQAKLEYMFYSGYENALMLLKYGYQDTPKLNKKQMLEQLDDAITKAAEDRERLTEELKKYMK